MPVLLVTPVQQHPLYIHHTYKPILQIAAWRVPIGETGVLEFFLGLAQGTGVHLAQTLRVVGNACVDCSKSFSLRP